MISQGLKNKYEAFRNASIKFQDIALLAMRLVLAYGFFHPAVMKVKNINGVIAWFASLGMPLPALNAYLATAAEILGVILLTIGLGVRVFTIPLIIVMIVAIVTVHWSNGFESGNNGFEIPLYYIIMLFLLHTHGSGKYSADALLRKK
jgi:putative oxidoreductase